MSNLIRIKCPAKLNLSLKVGERDFRGYHPIETTFQAISLCDEMEIELGGGGFEVIGAGLPSENTISKTLRLLQEAADIPPLGIRLIKRVPSQAGIGGGSSDAAGLIRAVKHILDSGIGNRELMDIALSVGADVPFFLVGGKANAKGYGEILIPCPDEPTIWFLILMPTWRTDTKEAYRLLDEIRWDGRRKEIDQNWYENDFLQIASHECFSILKMLDKLGAVKVGLCGSGAAMFCQAESKEHAQQIESDLKKCSQARLIESAWVERSLTRNESISIG